MSAWDWAVLICLIPLALYGWKIKYERWRGKQRKIARARRELLEDLRKGRA